VAICVKYVHMITLNLSDPNSTSQVAKWLAEQANCGECNRTLTFARRPHVVKLADGSIAIYAICPICRMGYEFYHRLDLYAGEGPKFAPRTYALPNIAAASSRIAVAL
jgi:hypothetical protein